MANGSVLVLLYILAQAVERIVELVSEFRIWGNPDSAERNMKRRRALWLWCVASSLGILLCWFFDVNFMRMLTLSVRHPYVNTVLSGIIVGSGAKPVHDIITTIERYALTK